ncbi:MAG: hypothetical protein H6R37_998 [Deltaproteobacteria bacterium]|nr:hypothetical protein [Deltaproteobacteria bacterium]
MDKTQFESLDQMAEATAATLAQAGASAAFQLFKDKRFRKLAGFDRWSQTEQDRIFNELVVANLVLFMLVFEAPDLRVANESRDYLAGLKKRIPQAYVQNLRDLGIEARYLRDWEKLIDMRYEEYARDKHDVRAAAMELESTERSLNMESLSKIQMLVPVEAVAIGCHHHICRGETKGKDDLFKLILQTLARFYFEFRMKIEGIKTTPFTRAHLAVKRSLDRIRTKKKD